MGIIVAGCFLAASVAVFAVAFTDSQESYETTVEINVGELGKLKCKKADGAVQCFGVPYAKQPQRFEDAQFPPPAWGYRDAFLREKSAPICVQGCHGPEPRNDPWFPGCPKLEDGGQSEQCLYLQIDFPDRLLNNNNDLIDQKLPVFVFNHGGGFGGGSPFFQQYDSRLLSSKGDIVVVAVAYRLGIFGGYPITRQYESKQVTGNLGLSDQQRALEFVHNFIKYFGGDSNRVTLAGQSAGAESAYIHTLMDGRHQDWFQQAWIMSGPLGLPYLTTEEANANVLPAIEAGFNDKYDQWIAEGKNYEKCSLSNGHDNFHECLKKLSTEDFKNIPASNHFFDGFQVRDIFSSDPSNPRAKKLLSVSQTWQPFIDGGFLSDQMVNEGRKKLQNTDKIIAMGQTGDEGELYSAGTLDSLIGSETPCTEEIYDIALQALLHSANPKSKEKEKVLDIYPYGLDTKRLRTDRGLEGQDCRDVANSAIRDVLWTCTLRNVFKTAQEKNPALIGKFYSWYYDEPFVWVPP